MPLQPVLLEVDHGVALLGVVCGRAVPTEAVPCLASAARRCVGILKPKRPWFQLWEPVCVRAVHHQHLSS